MVRHILLVKFTPETSEQDLSQLEQAFYQLKADIPGIEGVEFGANTSPEGLEKGYTHAVLMTFVDVKARDAYLPHAKHETFKAIFVPMIADILVFDYEF